jgi:hypothetical protein
MSDSDSILAGLRKVEADLDRIFEGVPLDVRTHLIQVLIDSVQAQAAESTLHVIATALATAKRTTPPTA